MSLEEFKTDNAEKAKIAEISGKWAEIIFTPDLVTGELINIGVCFKQTKNGVFHYRLATSLEKLSGIYGDSHMEQFQFLLGCAREHFALCGDTTSFSPHVTIGWYKPASGVSIQEILDSQFERMVTIAKNV